MSSGFLLVEVVPGREAQVLELIGRVQGVTHRSVLFPAAIAVKLESAGAVETVAGKLRALEGVVNARFYPAKNT